MFNILNNEEIASFSRFLKRKNGSFVSLSGLNNPFKLLLIDYLVKNNFKVLFLLANEQNALKFQSDLSAIKVDSSIFPYQETSFYDDVLQNKYIYQEQVSVLNSSNNVVLAPIKAIFEKFPNSKFYIDNSIKIKKDETLDYQKFIENLIKLGYQRKNIALDIGEFSVKGDIIDVYSLSKNPVRIEFFGDTIEDIRFFNPSNQKSFEKIKEFIIYPFYKFILDDKNKNQFANISFEDKNLHSELTEKLFETNYFEGIEYYSQYFNSNIQSFLYYFSDYVVIYDEFSQISGIYQNYDKELKEIFENLKNDKMKLPLKNYNHTTFEEFKSQISNLKCVGFDNFVTETDDFIEFSSSLPPLFTADIQKIAQYLKDKIKENYKIFICTNYASRIKEILNEVEIFSSNIEFLPSLSLGGGILEKSKVIFLTDKELFNKHSKDITSRVYSSNRSSQDYIDSVNDITQGEYVVHTIHGIGIYKGLCKQEIDGNFKDYLELEFAGSDKLFMPAEQVNLLFRYRGAGVNTKPQLSKMGGSSWEKTKSKAKKEVEEIAQDLLILYAKREMSEGVSFDTDTNWQFEMEEAFEFTETPDQLRAINETKADMEKARPMDRLICADVGFGKTEVALRAVFKAVMSGYQAVVVAPTTVLSLQHFKTFEERFKPFSVKVELMSRFKTKKEQKLTLENLKNGTCDVVVGTHRLLQDDVEFKNFGLLVIDEEHRFGVKHKEKLKNLRKNIDILSLSATPIPRTLNMALSGIKDMSVINTPPKNRLPVKTYVGEFREDYLKNAIYNEMARDGQIIYLYNRVETIYNFKENLEQIIPNAKIIVAHGQMSPNELENSMVRFVNQEFDVLLCTTIVESGLDMPNVNTIIIHDADRFGLAQLYQLRGRVGRSDRQAYCYCFYKPSKELTQDAYKRLNAIKDFTTLGSGYHIALKDAEIRGVGNILGAKQHGHMVSVGFDTYCNLLEECINEIKNGEKIDKKVITTIDLNVTAFIPDDWVGSVEQKIQEYKKLSDVKTLSELESMVLSLKDRFSKFPESVENLIKLIRLRILAENIKITSIRDVLGEIRLYTPFNFQEWLIIKNKNRNVTKYFEFQKPPKSLTDVAGIIYLKKNHRNFDEIFNILVDLFYHVSSTILEFGNNK